MKSINYLYPFWVNMTVSYCRNTSLSNSSFFHSCATSAAINPTNKLFPQTILARKILIPTIFYFLFYLSLSLNVLTLLTRKPSISPQGKGITMFPEDGSANVDTILPRHKWDVMVREYQNDEPLRCATIISFPAFSFVFFSKSWF